MDSGGGRRGGLGVGVVPGSGNGVTDGARLLRKDSVAEQRRVGNDLHGLGVEVHQGAML